MAVGVTGQSEGAAVWHDVMRHWRKTLVGADGVGSQEAILHPEEITIAPIINLRPGTNAVLGHMEAPSSSKNFAESCDNDYLDEVKGVFENAIRENAEDMNLHTWVSVLSMAQPPGWPLAGHFALQEFAQLCFPLVLPPLLALSVLSVHARTLPRSKQASAGCLKACP